MELRKSLYVLFFCFCSFKSLANYQQSQPLQNMVSKTTDIELLDVEWTSVSLLIQLMAHISSVPPGNKCLI